MIIRCALYTLYIRIQCVSMFVCVYGRAFNVSYPQCASAIKAQPACARAMQLARRITSPFRYVYLFSLALQIAMRIYISTHTHVWIRCHLRFICFVRLRTRGRKNVNKTKKKSKGKKKTLGYDKWKSRRERHFLSCSLAF